MNASTLFFLANRTIAGLTFTAVLGLFALLKPVGAADGAEGAHAPVSVSSAKAELKVGVSEAIITPPMGYPLAGYYHERLAKGTKDPLKAKVMYLAEGATEAVVVVCDLTGIASDLTSEVREKASRATGIKKSSIVVCATHSHTAPDYSKELWTILGAKKGPEKSKAKENERPAFIGGAIEAMVEAIKEAKTKAVSARLAIGVAEQKEPVSFNRRFVMRDGSVKTWANFKNKEVVRSAGPIDPSMQVVTLGSADGGKSLGVFSNFALHLDTVGGLEWSADYPFYLEQAVRKSQGEQAISLFGLGCCGDINHVDSSGGPVNKTPVIGRSLGATLAQAIDSAKPIRDPGLKVFVEEINLPILSVSPLEVLRAAEMLKGMQSGAKIDFLEQVEAYRTLILGQMLYSSSQTESEKLLGWGLSRKLRGIGNTIPVEVTVLALGPDLAFVFLPGEVFADIGLDIKRGSPFKATIVVELSNAVETAYIPTRGAFAQGGYEVINSMVRPGAGERLVETSLNLLRKAATELHQAGAKKE